MQPILSATHITKTFPGVVALDRASLSCRQGEVHGLVGENGAGKSTLMKILAGVHAPDAGDVTIKGERVAAFTPQHAQRLGVGIIYQELSLLPFLSVAQNIFLGREPRGTLGLVDDAAMERQAADILGRLGARDRISPRAPIHRLSPAHRQLVEIAKALSFRPDILIMDEPSSSLTEHERQQLFGVIRALRDQGATIIYISHRLEEIFELADRVTVLRDGQTVGTLLVAQAERATLIRMMVGREVMVAASPRRGQAGPVVLEVQGLTRAGVIHNISFVLRAGEILGVAGLIGAGRTELARALFGADPTDAGTVRLHGQALRVASPREAIDRGLTLVPEDRKGEGVILRQSVRENIALPSLKARQRLGFVNAAAERAMVVRSIQDLAIDTPSTGQQIAYLSGGNQQKAILAKWLNVGPQVMIFDEPTRGIDVGAKADIYALLRQLADAGKAILLITSELPEVLQLSDRILVLSGGWLAGELGAHEATEEKVLELAYKNLGLGANGRPRAARAADPEGRPARGARLTRGMKTLWSEALSNGSAVFGMFFLLAILGTVGSERFLTVPNLMNLLRQAMIPMLLGIGQTLVILSGGIDLSVSAVATMTTVFAAGLMAGSDARLWPVAMLCLVIGVLVGAINAFAAIKLRVPALIATLGTLVAGQGVALIYTREPIGVIPRTLTAFAHGRLGALPTSTIFLAMALGLGLLLLHKAAYGRHLYAVGGDEEIARLSGIAVDRIRAGAYLLSGLLAAVTGLYLTSRMGSGDPTVGPGLELDSIAAVLLGGTILGGGRGGLVGTIGGVMVLVVLNNVFNQLGVHTWYQQIAKGLIIILAVTIYRQKA